MLRREGQEQADMPGSGYIRLDEYKESLSRQGVKKVHEIQIHNKTIRSLCAKFEGLHANIIEVISIIDLYLDLFNKHHDSAKNIVNWSGSRRNWQRKQHQAIRDGIKNGYIEQYKKVILLSPKGQRVIDLYYLMFEGTINQYLRAAEARLKPSAIKKRNVRRAPVIDKSLNKRWNRV